MKKTDNISAFLLKICLLSFSLVISSSLLKRGGFPHHSTTLLADNEAVFFTDVTQAVGVDEVISQWGAAWGDYDNDGFQDLYAGNHFNTPNLYHNNGDGTFTDRRIEAGLKAGPDDWHGPAWGDYNNDGWLDLYIVTGQAVNGSDFYVNDGDGTFTERAGELNIKNGPGRGRQPSWVDYDRDGDLDLFVANSASNSAPSVLFRNNNNGSSFTDVAQQAGVGLTSGFEAAVWADYDQDGYSDLMIIQLGSAGPRGFRLFRNNGNGTFSESAIAAGLGNSYYPRGAAWGDYDNDGDLDLFFVRGYDPLQDRLIWNSNTITAVVAPPSSGTEGFSFSSSSSTVTFDLWKIDRTQFLSEIAYGAANQSPSSNPFTLSNSTNDHIGTPTFSGANTYIWRNNSTAPWNIQWSAPNVRGPGYVAVIRTPGQFSNVTLDGLDIPPGLTNGYPNLLYKNNGNGTFQQITIAGLTDSATNSRHAQWLDIDNDGDLDLYVTNMGNTYGPGEANRLYRNNNDGTFTDIAVDAGLTGPDYGNDTCSSWGDYNNDGFLDMYLANAEWVGYLSGPHKLYLNSGNANHWLEIKLAGIISNRPGIGAKIEVSSGDLTQFREVGQDASGPCYNSLLAHFGLDDYTLANVITVTWPSGLVQVIHNVPADQIVTIIEGQASQSDLSIVKTRVGSGEVAAGDSITYRLAVTSSQATSLVTATVVDTFSDPAALVGVSSSSDCGWTPGSATITCTVAGLINNITSPLTLTVDTSPTYSGTLTNTATVAPTQDITDPDLSNNSSLAVSVVVTTEPKQSDLSITKTRIGSGEVAAGDSITYSLTVTSSQATDLVTATVIDTFNDPAALAGISSPSNCVWTPDSAIITCTVAALVNNIASSLTLTVTTSPTYSGTLTNTATITPAQDITDPNRSNNSSPTVSVVISTAGGVIPFDHNTYLPLIIKRE